MTKTSSNNSDISQLLGEAFSPNNKKSSQQQISNELLYGRVENNPPAAPTSHSMLNSFDVTSNLASSYDSFANTSINKDINTNYNDNNNTNNLINFNQNFNNTTSTTTSPNKDNKDRSSPAISAFLTGMNLRNHISQEETSSSSATEHKSFIQSSSNINNNHRSDQFIENSRVQSSKNNNYNNNYNNNILGNMQTQHAQGIDSNNSNTAFRVKLENDINNFSRHANSNIDYDDSQDMY